MLKPQDVALPGQEAIQLPQADERGHLLQNLLLIRVTQGNILGDIIRQIAHIPAVHDSGDDLLRHVSGQLRVLAEQVPGLPQQRLRPGATLEGLGGSLLLQQFHVGLKEGLRLPQAAHAGPAAPLHHHPDGVGRQAQDLGDMGHRADLVQVLLLRLVHTDLPLSHQEDVLVRLHSPLQSSDGDTALHIKGQAHMGKNRQAPESQDGNIQCRCFHMEMFPF